MGREGRLTRGMRFGNVAEWRSPTILPGIASSQQVSIGHILNSVIIQLSSVDKNLHQSAKLNNMKGIVWYEKIRLISVG